MEQYHKISNVFRRTTDTFKLIEGDWMKPEFEYLQNNLWHVTEKVDGTNIRIQVTKDGLKFRGKSDNAQMPTPLLEHLMAIFGGDNFTKITQMFDQDFCIYGEGYGGSIQKGSKYNPTQTFTLFDVKVGNNWLGEEDLLTFAGSLNLPRVPIIGEMTLIDAIEFAKKGFKSHYGDFNAEGIIAKPLVELTNEYGERVIVKIKSLDFEGQR